MCHKNKLCFQNPHMHNAKLIFCLCILETSKTKTNGMTGQVVFLEVMGMAVTVVMLPGIVTAGLHTQSRG